MTAKTKTVLSLVVNCLVLTVTTGVVISYFFVPGKAIRSGPESFRFFTTDANVLAAVAAALTAVCQIQILRGRRSHPLRAAAYLKLAGVVSLLLTFLTVMVLLVPAYGAAMQLGGTAFHMHVAAPTLSFVSFVWLDGHRRLPLSAAWVGIVPVVAYGALYLTQVVLLHNWEDFYLFNSGGLWYVTAPVMIAVAGALSLLAVGLQRKMCKTAR